MSDWDWSVACYYADSILPPRTPRACAISTVHRGVGSMQMEVLAARGREDIGRIDVVWIGRGPQPSTPDIPEAS